MKCPHLKTPTIVKKDTLEPVSETFADCYHEECMAYVPETRRYVTGVGVVDVPQRCLRLESDLIEKHNPNPR